MDRARALRRIDQADIHLERQRERLVVDLERHRDLKPALVSALLANTEAREALDLAREALDATP